MLVDSWHNGPVAINSQPSASALFNNALHLIWVLQSTQGLGVRPAMYSSTKLSTTKSPNSSRISEYNVESHVVRQPCGHH